jgi:hypothetical protein
MLDLKPMTNGVAKGPVIPELQEPGKELSEAAWHSVLEHIRQSGDEHRPRVCPWSVRRHLLVRAKRILRAVERGVAAKERYLNDLESMAERVRSVELLLVLEKAEEPCRPTSLSPWSAWSGCAPQRPVGWNT